MGLRKSRTCVLNMSMNEGQDNPHDSSGYGNNGTNNGASWINGTYGHALHFDGSTYISIVDDDTLDFGTDSFAISFWFKAQTTGWKEVISKKGDANHYWGCYDGGTNYKMRWRLQGGSSTYMTVTQDEVVFDNNWCYAVWTIDRENSEVVWYFNGIKSTPETDISILDGLHFDSGNPIHIAAINPPGSYLTGDMSKIKITKFLPTGDEILSDFNATKARYGL